MRRSWCHVGLARRSFHVRRPELETVEARSLLTHGIGTIVSALPGIEVGPPLSPEVVAGEAFDNLVVADFWSSRPGASASDFTATVDWGDGSTVTAATVVPLVSPWGPILAGAGSAIDGVVGGPVLPPVFAFSVTGGHTYASSGSYTAHVTVADSAGDTATTTADITASASRLVVQPITTSFQAVTGAAYDDIPLAGFTDLGVTSATPAPASDYTATIDWGDGTSATAGTITPDDFGTANFDVSGGHTFTSTGTYNVQVTIADQAGDTVSATRTVNVSTLSLTAQGTSLSLLTGQSGPPLVVASLTTSPAGAHVPASDYTVTIDWGDGTSATAGQVVGESIWAGPPLTAVPNDIAEGGPLSVVGEHTYAQAGTYTIQVTIDGPGGATASATSTATVAGIAAQGVSFKATTNQADTNQTVAFFHTGDATAAASDFTATIDWGDGTTTTSGTITEVPTPILGPVGGGTASHDVAIGIGGLPLPPFGLPRFVVSGTHTYTTSGTYTVQVTINGPGGDTTTTTATATVANDTITAYPVPVFATPGQTTGTVPVAGFRDQAGLPPSDFTATIDWGDGTSTTGTVIAAPVLDPPGGVRPLAGASTAIASPIWEPFYLVTGSHTYATAGQYTIQVTITSTLGATANVSTTADVGTPPPPIVTPVQPVVGHAHPGQTHKPSSPKGSTSHHHTPVIHHPRPTVKIHTSSRPHAAHRVR